MKAQEKSYFESFREVAKAVNSSLDLKEVLNLLVSNVTQAMDLKACIIRLLDPKRRTLEVAASHGLSKKFLNKGPVDADKSISDVLEGQTVSIYNVIGVMRLYTPEPREFSEEEINSAEALAEMGAIAIENARMYERIKWDYETVKSFREVAKAVNSSLDVQTVLDLLVIDVVQIMDLKACAIRLLHGKRRTLEVAASHGLSDKYLNKGPIDALLG